MSASPRNPDPDVRAMEKRRDRATEKARKARPKIVAGVIALRTGGACLAVEPDASSGRMEATKEGRIMPSAKAPNPHD